MKPIGLSSKWRTVLPFIVVFVILVIIFPKVPKFGYEYRKGSPWKYETLYAQFDFPILKTEEQIQEEKSKSVEGAIPYYKYSEETVNKNLKAAEALSLGGYSSVKPLIVSALREIYSRGIVPDEGVRMDRNTIDISDEVMYVQRDKRAAKYPVTEVYKLTDARAKLVSEVAGHFKQYNLDSLFKANSIYDLVVPNLVFDKQTTELLHAESGSEISPTIGFVNNGQLIVSQNEIVTSEIAQMLDSYKVEYENNLGYSGRPSLLFWLGNALLAFSIMLLMFLTIYFTYKSCFTMMNRILFVLLVFLISTVCALTIGREQPINLYMVPFALPALWLQSFFKNRTVLMLYVISLLPLLIFTHSGTVLFVMFTIGGFVAIFSFKYFVRGWHQLITTMFMFLTMLIVYFGFRSLEMVSGNVGRTLTYLFIGSLLTVLGYQMIYIFEAAFNLVSSSRLADLCDTSNPLLRELETKAPGTFQHSLQVMTMADKAARSIGAESVLVRVGALYHDIGKMNNPQCFIENASLVAEDGKELYHAGLDPKQSAREIIAHVTDGLEIAEKHKLPDLIKNFIRTHHGTARADYFYNKYINEGGNPEDVADFYYTGMKPYTKEQVVLMVCDSVEAASRTLKNCSTEAYSELVENIVKIKFEEGQFDDADITLKELNILMDTLKSYLAQLYHERVVYPKRKEKPAN